MNIETDVASSRDTLLAMALQVQALETIVNELQQLVQSKDDIEAQVAAQYETRISELEEENEKLTHENNEALLIRETAEALELEEGPDLSPVLEQRLLNLQTNIARVRNQYQKREVRYIEELRRLERLAMGNVGTLILAIKRQLRDKVPDEDSVMQS